MNRISEKERLDYYWKHFALIADQRVKTFNFYIIVVLATITGSIGALRASTPRWTFLLIGAGHILVVVVFWMIEARGKAILKIAKEALWEFEASPEFGDGYQPLTQDERKPTKGPWNLVTYGNAFQLVFVAHLLFGLVIACRPTLIVPRPPSTAENSGHRHPQFDLSRRQPFDVPIPALLPPIPQPIMQPAWPPLPEFKG